jgi:hypothetical protein
MSADMLQKWADENGVRGIRASSFDGISCSPSEIIDSIIGAISAFQRGESKPFIDPVELDNSTAFRL